MCDFDSKFITKLENDCIASMSFVPSKDQFNLLLETSKLAVKSLENKVPTCLLSKVPVLVPKTFNPNDTILVKMASTPSSNAVELKKNYLYVINDRDIPFTTLSNGPNGVLTNCQSTVYGINRMNLFHKNMNMTLRLANDYIQARNKNIEEIFRMFCEKLYTVKDTEFGNDYILTSDMYNIINSRFLGLNKPKSDPIKALNMCGVNVVSFCQTWAKGESTTSTPSVGMPQFSIPSPHFQTRFYIQNEKKVLNIPGLTKSHLLAYGRVIKKFTLAMQTNYGYCGNGKSFVHLDNLIKTYN